MELQFNEETKQWEERKEPYATIEIPDQDDYEFLENCIRNRERIEKFLKRGLVK